MRHLLRLKCIQNAQDACIRTLSNARNHQVSDASATLAKLHAQRHVGRSSRRHVRTIARLTMTYVSKAFTTLKELHARRHVGCISEESSNTTTKSMQFTQTRILLETVHPEKRPVKARFLNLAKHLQSTQLQLGR